MVRMESGNSANSNDIAPGSIQQQFSVPSTSPAVSIIAQDPSKGLYIVDQSQQHATLQMFTGADQRLISAAGGGNPVELAAANANPASAAQTIMVT